jgi:hypothetical protein
MFHNDVRMFNNDVRISHTEVTFLARKTICHSEGNLNVNLIRRRRADRQRLSRLSDAVGDVLLFYDVTAEVMFLYDVTAVRYLPAREAGRHRHLVHTLERLLRAPDR